MSQEELGRRVGVTKGAVSAWESGATELSMRRANDVARALDMNIIQLMHGITSTATDSTQIDGGSIVPRVRMGGLEFLNPDWRGPEKTPLSAIGFVARGPPALAGGGSATLSFVQVLTVSCSSRI